jgi:hypothetical protein
MLATHVKPWDPSAWPTGTAVIVGAIVTLVVLYVGSRMHRRRRTVPLARGWTQPWPGPVAAPPATDPFVQGSDRERRSAPRRQGNPVPLLITPAGSEGEPLRGLILDRSLGGVRLSLDQEVREGAVLRLRPGDGFGEAPWVEARVVHSLRVNGHWEAGCQFLRTPSWNVMLLFG